MAGIHETEEQRIVDRIKRIAFREARDGGATFINRQWIAQKIHHSTRFVSEWWERSYDDCSADYSECGRKLKLADASGKQKRSSYSLVEEIAAKHKEYIVAKTVDNYRHREALKPFHVISRPLKTETHISDRLCFCDWLKDWIQEGFLHFVPSDEFYVWTVRTPNYQNDRVSAKSIEDDEKYREMGKNQACISIFVIFTTKKLHRAIKDKGRS